MLLLLRCVEWTIILSWKFMLKIWPKIKVITWSEKVMLHIRRSVSSAWTQLCCFHRSSWSLSKVIAEQLLVTFHGLKWPRRHERSLVAIFWFKVSSLPANRCLRVFRIVFVQKRRLSIFSHWLTMERSQSWPDLRSQISKLWDIHFIDNVTNTNPWKFQGDRFFGLAMTSIETFSEVRSH